MLTLTSDTKIALINYFSYWILFPEFLFSDDEEDCYESEAKLSLTPCHESPLPPSSLPSHSPLPRHAPDSPAPTIKVCTDIRFRHSKCHWPNVELTEYSHTTMIKFDVGMLLRLRPTTTACWSLGTRAWAAGRC